MKILYNESLAKYTTFRIGGIAKTMYFPETVDDLLAIQDLSNSKIIGAGSNLLINDEAVFESVVSTSCLNKKIERLENENFFIGAGVRIQNAIASVNKFGHGGIEYLVSIPASIGGAIYMNAGVYSPKKTTISDHLVNVSVLVDGHVEIWDKEKCLFSKRHSIFHTKKAIVLGAEFNFPKQELDCSKKKIAERMAIAKKQDHSGGNCGSVFKVCNYRLMRLLKLFHPQVGGASYSQRSSNWIVNNGEARYKDVKKLMRLAFVLHRVFLQKIEEEVVEWDC